MTLIEIEGVAALKPQDSGHVANLINRSFLQATARRVSPRADYLDLQPSPAPKCRP